jgi:DNA-binding CsgD family transcriptional regulator
MTPQYDWRDFVNTSTDHEARANQHRPTELSAVQREILRLHKTGLQPRDLATLFGLTPSAVEAVIYGDEPGSRSV